MLQKIIDPAHQILLERFASSVVQLLIYRAKWSLKMDKIEPSVEYLKTVLRYDELTGHLFWKVRKTARTKIGERAGSLAKFGYRVIKINYIFYKEHRVAWAMFHNEWPKDQIDHINHQRDDNRISNLRSATRSENARNQKLKVTNSSGHNGVGRSKNGKYHAYIFIGGKKKHLGFFDDLDSAVARRELANLEFGFHPTHGGKDLPLYKTPSKRKTDHE